MKMERLENEVKKKVGLITFHNSINYGVFLQAYALQTFIELAGYEAEIIDYNKFTENKKKKSIVYRIKHLKESLKIFHMICFLHKKRVKEKEGKFRIFAQNNFKLSKLMGTFDDIVKEESEYDKFVCGSDQIWNPEYTQGNPVYFLRFTPREKRIAYAPSFGVRQLSKILYEYLNKYKLYLSEFSAISVRESTGQSIIHDFLSISPNVVVDPTLLLSEKCWQEKCRKVQIKGKKYVLFYVLGDNYLYRKLAKKIAAQGRYTVMCIPTNPLWDRLRCVKRCYAGIDEFLYLIRNAEYIITDSFHGTAFSVIFRKNFSAILRNDTAHSLCSRIEDFLGKIHLQKNCVNVSDILSINVNNKTNYSYSVEVLETWIEESKEYLEKALSEGNIGE